MAYEYNLEEVYIALFAASRSYGVKYNVIAKWFTQCQIIDGRILTEELFIRSYERLCPNREDLSQTEFIQLIGILSRETRQNADAFVKLFNTVKKIIVDEIVESKMNEDYTKS